MVAADLKRNRWPLFRLVKGTLDRPELAKDPQFAKILMGPQLRKTVLFLYWLAIVLTFLFSNFFLTCDFEMFFKWRQFPPSSHQPTWLLKVGPPLWCAWRQCWRMGPLGLGGILRPEFEAKFADFDVVKSSCDLFVPRHF